MTGYPWDHTTNRAVLADDLNAAFAQAYATAGTAYTNAVVGLATASSALALAETVTAGLATLIGQIAAANYLRTADAALIYQTAAQVGVQVAALQAIVAATYQPLLGYTAYNSANPANYQSAAQVWATMAATIVSTGQRPLELLVSGDIPVGIMHDQFGMPVYVPQ
jgi:hypothetical protein